MQKIENKKNTLRMIIRKDIFVKSFRNNIKDRYSFQKILGKGAFGKVYLAVTNYFPNEVRAIKVIDKDKIKNPQNLIDEVSILKQLDHPSIIKIYETYENQKHLCLVLDYCQGGQLYQRMARQGYFSERKARNVFSQMVKTVKYLHNNNVCHRDLKLQNFLFDNQKSLNLKIIDFGLSKKWKNDLRKQLKVQRQNKTVGTIYYIAPQVIKKDYDERCDIWSLGVLLYILVTGCPPFNGKDDKEIMKNISKINYSLKAPQLEGLSPEILDLISRILVAQDKRISLDQILTHKWMTKIVSDEPLKLDFNKIKQFTSFTKLKRLVLTYVASQLPQQKIHELGQTFKKVDKDMNGLLTSDQIKQALQKQQDKVSYGQLLEVLSFIDTDHNGRINYNEFIAACIETSHYNNERYLARIFEYFDVNKDGTLSVEEFKEILACTQIEKRDKRFMSDLIEDVDLNKDGKIDYKEFLSNMIKPA